MAGETRPSSTPASSTSSLYLTHVVEGELAVLDAVLDVLGGGGAGDAAEDDDVEQGVAHQAVGAVDAATHLAGREEARARAVSPVCWNSRPPFW